MVGRIHSNLFFQSKFLLNDINIKIRLVSNKDSFYLMGAADATFKIRIVDCKLHVRKNRLSLSVFIAQEKVPNDRHTGYNYEFTE